MTEFGISCCLQSGHRLLEALIIFEAMLDQMTCPQNLSTAILPARRLGAPVGICIQAEEQVYVTGIQYYPI